MKRPAKKRGALLPIIGFFFVAALFYGLIIEPLTGKKPTDEIVTQAIATDAPPDRYTETSSDPEPYIAETSAPTEAPTDPPSPTPTSRPTPAPTPEPTPTFTPEPTEPPTLRQGDKGDAVRDLQSRLIGLGYLSGSADGDFGRKTTQAVKDFQVCNGLKEDGIFGASCWDCISGYRVVPQRPVYVSKNKVYHIRENCSGMKNSTKMNLSDAIRKGYKSHNCK